MITASHITSKFLKGRANAGKKKVKGSVLTLFLSFESISSW